LYKYENIYQNDKIIDIWDLQKLLEYGVVLIFVLKVAWFCKLVVIYILIFYTPKKCWFYAILYCGDSEVFFNVLSSFLVI